MTDEATWIDKTRAILQWFRVPLMAAFVVFGIWIITRSSSHTVPAWLWVGMGVTLAGEFGQLWAASQLKKDRVLATSGPYAHVRNPMYCGRFLVLLGFMIMIQQATWDRTQAFGVPLIVVGYFILFWMYAYGRVKREEARLESIFTEDYAHYCKEVRRFIPRFSPYSRTAGLKWQWSGIVRNHEYLNLVAAIIVFAIIVVLIRTA